METEEQIIQIIIMSLAIWRLSCIITSEEFVFGIAQKIRTKLGVKQEPIVLEWNIGLSWETDVDGSDYPFYQDKKVVKWIDLESELQTTRLARGITCMWCVSWWLGIAWTIGYLLVPDITFVISLPVALSALAIGYERLAGS